jgi:pilus assembly protein CpaC
VGGGGTILAGTPSNIVQPVNIGGSTQLVHIPLPGEGLGPSAGSTEIVPNPLTIGNHGLFGSFMDGTTLFNVAIDAAQQSGLAKILAEPTLTTMTGQEATFHAGGEFPVPIYGGPNQGTTILFKEFGISLGFIPVVLDSGTINLKVNIRVSELSNQNAVAVNVPQTSTSFFVNSLTTRSATSTIELGSGQTMGIAGLIDESLREQVDKFPGLGDLPILGALFRSQDYVKGQTELVILVTPTFAKPNAREAFRLPTEAFVDPDAIDFYLLGRMEGADHGDHGGAGGNGSEVAATTVPPGHMQKL